MTKLTAKQEMFCREYLIDLNATQAAIRAGYSKKTSRVIGLENLAKPGVAARISDLMKKRSDKVEINSDYVLKRLVDMDQLDIVDILDDEDRLKPVSKWPKEWRQSISAFDVTVIAAGSSGDDPITFLKKIKWIDKAKILELIGRHVEVQAFKDRVSQEHSIDTTLKSILGGLDGSSTGIPK